MSVHVAKELSRETVVDRRIVRTITTAAPVQVIPGIRHTAVIRTDERELSDPFLLLSDDRIDGGHGARVGAAHPHAGMESATLLLEDSITDGDAAPLQAGDLQWMTAGSGIVHDEAVIARGSVRLLQLWITLPHDRRWTAPGFQDVRLDSLPIRREPGVVVRLYSGLSGALISPTQNHVPVTIADFLLEAGSSVDQELPASYNGLLYLLDGSVRVGADELRAGQVGWLDSPPRQGSSNVHLIAGEGGARLILYAGEPQNTHVIMQGPFVGESGADISRLDEEYRQGRFPHMSELAALKDAVVVAEDRK
jgi:redox-sensitive bicupin YhaK (pirin superfamily)